MTRLNTIGRIRSGTVVTCVMGKAVTWGLVLEVGARAHANAFPKKWEAGGIALAQRQRVVSVLTGQVRTVVVLVSYPHVNRA